MQFQALPQTNSQSCSAARGDAGPSRQALVRSMVVNASNQGAQRAPQLVCGNVQATTPDQDTRTSFSQDQVREICRTEDQVVVNGLARRIEEVVEGTEKRCAAQLRPDVSD